MLSFILLPLLTNLGPSVAQQAFSGSNQIPDVTLLVDNPGYNQTTSIKSLLAAVSAKKGKTFQFGVAYDAGNATNDPIAISKLSNTFNHGVAENNCKWQFTEPAQNVSNLTACENSQNFFAANDASFRLHNTFWHQQTPTWLPGSFSAAELVGDIIPTHVKQEAGGIMNYTSVDVLNEIVGDSTSLNMTAYECVANKQVWPTTVNDTDPTPLVTDLSFVSAALQAAGASTNATLVLNDYSTGGNNSKTACYYKLSQYLQAQNVPLSGIGFQSHVGAKANNFDSKEALQATFAQFGAIGLDALITEFDVWLQDASYASLRWQAAIYGDYLDACLYSDNCHEFVVWGLYDAVSWLNTFPGRGVSMPLLFDVQGVAKLNYYELIARFERYISGNGEVCAAASGSATCDLTQSQYQVNGTSTGTASAAASASTANIAAQSTGSSSLPAASGAVVPVQTTSAAHRVLSMSGYWLALVIVAAISI